MIVWVDPSQSAGDGKGIVRECVAKPVTQRARAGVVARFLCKHDSPAVERAAIASAKHLHTQPALTVRANSDDPCLPLDANPPVGFDMGTQ